MDLMQQYTGGWIAGQRQAAVERGVPPLLAEFLSIMVRVEDRDGEAVYSAFHRAGTEKQFTEFIKQAQKRKPQTPVKWLHRYADEEEKTFWRALPWVTPQDLVCGYGISLEEATCRPRQTY